MKYLCKCLLLLPLRPTSYQALLWLLRRLRMLPLKVESPNDPPRHILVVNLTDFVGDTIMMMPLLDRLHAVLPNAEIDLVTSAAMSNYVGRIPFLRLVLGLRDGKTRIPIWKEYKRLVAMRRLVKESLANEAYDLCLLPRWGTDPEMSTYLAAMTSATRIVGHDPAEEIDTRNPFPGSNRLFSDMSHGGSGLPEAIRELRLVEACGIVERLDPLIEELRPIAALVNIANSISLSALKDQVSLGHAGYAVLAPGASTATKRWPPEFFAEVARALEERWGLKVVLIGSPAESEIGQHIERHLLTPSNNLIGRTTLLETTALLSQATLLIANDSGPAHIGAGLGTPTLVLSPSPLTCTREVLNSPRRFRPVGPHVTIVQPEHPSAGCGDRCVAHEPHCILGITVSEVKKRVEEVLQQRAKLSRSLELL